MARGPLYKEVLWQMYESLRLETMAFLEPTKKHAKAKLQILKTIEKKMRTLDKQIDKYFNLQEHKKKAD